MAVEFNKQLKARVKRLRKELLGASVIYVDVYSAKYHLISNTKTYGFMEPMKICCGHHEKDIHVWCGQRTIINGSEILGVSCGSPESYGSWDGINDSQGANQWIANHILNGSFSDPPTPISHACLKH
ncbi:Alpha-L-fucosidase [Handroanthus impetiginosus]|uniref:Alpha-L-fucosidase n=1 Tax=Handroanthus impetiginosus TaxID=429701 RepID=A0A2G9FY04_9LAMI|nr:Alpha-L-fucosidase [Handroanthus impetiginosus]